MATDKRARKKQYRNQKRAAMQAAIRRRRAIRLTAVLVVVAVLFALAFTVGGGKNEPNKKPAAAPSKAASTNQPVACGAQAPPPAHPKTYDAPPKNQLKPGVDYGAVIHTSCGDIKIDLLEDQAPVTVNNFVFLAKQGFYDGLTWHRIVQNFVIQGGDPEGTGAGGPGYQFKDELPAKPSVYTFGAVAMANSGPDTNGSQFFIVAHKGPKGQTNEAPAGLQAAYSLFGEADKSSWDVIDKISKIPTQGGNDPNTADRPLQTVYINSIDITES